MAPKEGQLLAPPWRPERGSPQPPHGAQRRAAFNPTVVAREGLLSTPAWQSERGSPQPATVGGCPQHPENGCSPPLSPEGGSPQTHHGILSTPMLCPHAAGHRHYCRRKKVLELAHSPSGFWVPQRAAAVSLPGAQTSPGLQHHEGARAGGEGVDGTWDGTSPHRPNPVFPTLPRVKF